MHEAADWRRNGELARWGDVQACLHYSAYSEPWGLRSAVSDRDYFVTLTYDDVQLLRLEGSVDAAHDIDEAKPHFRPFIQRVREMWQRLHPELACQVSYFKVAEYGDEYGRVHWHVILSFRLEWADEDRRAKMPRPVWDDRLIPHLQLEERYIHEWETVDEELRRKKKKTRVSRFPSRIPWPWGFSYWENCGGGEADYTAGYCTKGIELYAASIRKAREGEQMSEDDREKLRKAWQSFKSKGRSQRYGQRFYADRGRLTALHGLPANTYFKVPMMSKAIPNDLYGRVAGSDERRYLKVSRTHGTGQLWVQDFMVPRTSSDFMLTGLSARTYLDAYDEEYRRLRGEARKPLASTVRTRPFEGRERAYRGVTVAEMREAKQKYEWAQEDRRFLEKRRRAMMKGEVGVKHLTVADELKAQSARDSAKRQAAKARGHYVSGPLWRYWPKGEGGNGYSILAPERRLAVVAGCDVFEWSAFAIGCEADC